MIKTYKGDRSCDACGYWPNVRRAKFEVATITYDTDRPTDIVTRCNLCGNVHVSTLPGRKSKVFQVSDTVLTYDEVVQIALGELESAVVTAEEAAEMLRSAAEEE